MDKKILYVLETGMKELPESCVKCTMLHDECGLPWRPTRLDKLYKAAETKRMKECPLREVGLGE